MSAYLNGYIVQHAITNTKVEHYNSNGFLTRLVSGSRPIAGETVQPLLCKKTARKSSGWAVRNVNFPSRQRQRNPKPWLFAAGLCTPHGKLTRGLWVHVIIT